MELLVLILFVLAAGMAGVALAVDRYALKALAAWAFVVTMILAYFAFHR